MKLHTHIVFADSGRIGGAQGVLRFPVSIFARKIYRK
jgi:hypothetical protein